jgi:thiol:disulfide interchange protein DsbD
MINSPTTKVDWTAKRQTLLLVMLIFGGLLLSSCNNNKPSTYNKTGNAFSGDVNTGMLYPCHWSFTVEQDSPGEATLVSTAKIDSGWHLYSQYISDKGSPMVFAYNTLPDYKLEGGTEEGVSQKEFDPYLNIDILYFENEAVFRQKIKVLGKEDFIITGTIEYSACLTVCVPSEEDFSFKVKGNPQGE